MHFSRAACWTKNMFSGPEKLFVSCGPAGPVWSHRFSFQDSKVLSRAVSTNFPTLQSKQLKTGPEHLGTSWSPLNSCFHFWSSKQYHWRCLSKDPNGSTIYSPAPTTDKPLATNQPGNTFSNTIGSPKINDQYITKQSLAHHQQLLFWI